jgi:hypothetical protein
MHHVKLDSKQVFSIAYDPVEETMEAKFHCGNCRGKEPLPNCAKCAGTGHSGTYVYSGVPAATYAAVRDAKTTGKDHDFSHGKAFNALIKRGGFKYTFTPSAGAA